MFNKAVLTVAVTAVISGCSITPQAISPDSIQSSIQTDLGTLDAAVDPVLRPIDLNEAIARAVKFNRDRKLQALEAALEQDRIDIAERDLLPKLTASAGYAERNNYAASASVTFVDGEPSPLGSNPTYSVSQDKQRATADVAFSWNVLDFGLSYIRAKQQADRYLIAKERERKVAHNITQSVRAAYWQAVSAERLLGKIGPLIDTASAALEASRQVEQQQLRSPLEALYYQRELLEILRSLQSLRQNLIHAKVELAAFMGLRPGTPYELADVNAADFGVPSLDLPVEQMEALALAQRPELVQTHYQERISAEETRAAVVKLLPGISFTAGSYHDNSDYLLNQDWTSVGAQVSWNLFDLFKVGAERRLAKTQAALAQEQRLATSMAVLAQVHLANIRYAEARSSFDLASRFFDVAQRIDEQTQNAAQLQRKSELDLIRESLNTLLAELRRDVAYAELQNSYGQVFVSMGMDLVPEHYPDVSVDSLRDSIGDQLNRWQRGDLDAATQVQAAPDEEPVS